MKKRIMLILLAVVLIGAAVWAFGVFDKTVKVPYTSFREDLDAGKITGVDLYKDRITFKTAYDDVRYETDNPDRNGFKEELLLGGVVLADHTREDDGLNYYLDMLFNIIFIGLILFGVWKLVSLYRSTFRVVHHTGIKFDRIAGMENVKRDMGLVVNYLKDPKAAAQKGIRPIKGIILEGPPGNGKTLFARALAEECGVDFIATKGADFQSALMSMGAMKIKLLFSKARRNRPCIIFIDEFDSIGERRNYAGSGIDKENNRIITTMLNEMDGFTPSSGILVIGATNSYQSLDPALIRAGRFDLKYHIGNPDPETRKALIRLYSAGKKLSPDLGEGRLSDSFRDLSCAEIETLLNEAAAIAMADGNRDITYADIVEASGKTDIKLNGHK
ncbi:MAG: AAA family ATPase [Anaerolineaceae bacterium]|nr:AAA family ATPase [Anaerolineaceae bacterium]